LKIIIERRLFRIYTTIIMIVTIFLNLVIVSTINLPFPLTHAKPGSLNVTNNNNRDANSKHLLTLIIITMVKRQITYCFLILEYLEIIVV
jgi:hypothetical protein